MSRGGDDGLILSEMQEEVGEARPEERNAMGILIQLKNKRNGCSCSTKREQKAAADAQLAVAHGGETGEKKETHELFSS